MEGIETKPAEQQAIGGAYEGASRTSREIALWSPVIQSADSEINKDKMLLDARSRDRMANDGYVLGAVHTTQDSVVGGQYLLNCKPHLRVLQNQNPAFDDVWLEEFRSVVESRFNLYTGSSNNYIDASRINNLTSMLRLAIGVHCYTGEVLATAEWVRESDRPYKTAIQMVDLDRLSNPYDREDTTRLRRGIERDRNGKPVAAHIRVRHPNDWLMDNADAYTWRRVPFRKPWGRKQVIHLYEQKRPDQSRGISDMVSVLKQMKMTAKFQDIALQSAVLQATYAATIESELPADAAYNQLGEGNSANWATQYLSQIAEYVGSSKNIHIDGVKIPHLYPGTKLNLKNAGANEGVGTNFEQSMLRHIAAVLGLSYEQFSRDYTQTNYSSARASMLETQKRMSSRKKLVADRFADEVFQLVFEEMLNMGDVPMPVGVGPEFFYEGMNREALTSAHWVGASRGQIDELKETQAAIMRMSAGLSTYEEECAKLGRDYRDVLDQRQREQEMLQERGLTANLSTKPASAEAVVNDANGENDAQANDDLGLD